LQIQHTLTKATWLEHQAQLRGLRNKINVLELRTPRHVEFDEKDASAQHVLVCMEDDVIACGRLTRTGVISRICVLQSHRGLGVGAQILEALVSLADASNMSDVSISSTLATVEFYTQYGFKPQGNVFMQGGLPRQHVVSSIGNISFM